MLTIFVNQIWLAANSRGYLRRSDEDEDSEDEEYGLYGDEEKEIEHNCEEEHINNIVDTSSKSNFLSSSVAVASSLSTTSSLKTDDDKLMMTTNDESNTVEEPTTTTTVDHCEYHCQCKRNDVYYKWTEKDGAGGSIHKSGRRHYTFTSLPTSSSSSQQPPPSTLYGLYNVLLGCIVVFCLAMSLLFFHQMGSNDLTFVPTNFREELRENQDLLRDIVMDILKNVTTTYQDQQQQQPDTGGGQK